MESVGTKTIIKTTDQKKTLITKFIILTIKIKKKTKL